MIKTELIAAAIALMVGLPGVSDAVELYAGGKTEAEISTEIVIRCQYQIGEFGNVAVEMCIQSEHEARRELAAYPEETAEIVLRCTRTRYKAGWGMIKLCADKDLAAQAALQNYAPEHQSIIEACHDKVGLYGPAEVKECVDKQIASMRDGQQ